MQQNFITNLNLKDMETNKTNRANSAKETAKRANDAKTVEAVEAVEAVDVESVPASLPVAKETESGKVTTKEVLKSVCSVRAAIKEERRGANVTIRLIAERAASGDTDSVVIC